MGLKATIVTLLIFLVACSDTTDTSQSCFPAKDSITIVGSSTNEESTFFLIHRLAGFNDKIEIFEIYNQKPNFDQCSQSNIEVLAADSIDTRNKDNKDQHVIEVSYTKNPSEISFTYAPGAIGLKEQLETLQFLIK